MRVKPFLYAGIALSLLGGTAGLTTIACAQAGSAAQVQANRDADNPPTTADRVVPGDRVPDSYQQDQYVVTAWESFGLESPPTGYRWLRNDRGGQYLLTSQRTGQVADTVDQALRHDTADAPAQWAAGDQLSGADLAPRFVVVDWKGAGLPRPARGYHWINIHHHYLLTSRQTGVISEVR